MNERSSENHRRKQLPSVDRLLNDDQIKPLVELWGRASIHAAIRAIQDDLRSGDSSRIASLNSSEYANAIENWLVVNRKRAYQRVFNTTGTILHTNLGRALIDPDLYDRVRSLVTEPATIEFDLDSGQRGQREAAVCERLCRLTNAEAASIVNNNAAAVLIVLNTLANEKKVVVSRGELIEIGGSFRLPDIMRTAGCELLEVGTTNRTHKRDYEAAIAQQPALLLKAHPSNYRIEGFTQEVNASDLAQLGKANGIPSLVDLGSGALVDTRQFGLPREPIPSDLLNVGIDLVTFSGDKLLGGPQAGLIVGSQDLIDAINGNPMKRAMRTSKITLALLDETLKAYEDSEQLQVKIPTLRALGTGEKELRHRARLAQQVLAETIKSEFGVTVEESEAEVGSGSMPGNTLPSIALRVQGVSNTKTQEFHAALRRLTPAIIGRLSKGAVYLDMRGAQPIGEFLDTLKQLK